MLAKMDADSLLTGSAQQVLVGGSGLVGSMGGVFIDSDNTAGVAPDIAVGDDDILHVTYFNPGNSATSPIVYKSVPAGEIGISRGPWVGIKVVQEPQSERLVPQLMVLTLV